MNASQEKTRQENRPIVREVTGMKTSIRNVGIFAHVDAGKTTLTEQLLFFAGAISAAGNVDKGTSTTDTMTVERERGISVRLATASFEWQGVRVNLVDTPGHVDFCAEVERSLRALDCAVLVISAVEGVQAHTSTIFGALQAMNIPTLFFINKIDRIGADALRVVSEIKTELTENVLLLHLPENQGESDASVQKVWQAGENDKPCHGTDPAVGALIEAMAEKDDVLLAKFLAGEIISFSELDKTLAQATAACEHYPVLLGVAKNGLGVPDLLDAIIRYLPGPQPGDDDPLSAIVYRIDHHPKLGKIAGVRVFSGTISPRDSVVNCTQAVTEKVSQLKKVQTRKYEDIRVLGAGDIGVVCGLSNAGVGDVLGSDQNVPAACSLSAPLLTVVVQPENEADFSKLSSALSELTVEDPMLGLEFLPDQRELHLKITGWIQIEVLESVLLARFKLKAVFSSPTVIYKETPSRAGFGFERYWMPKPCWAIMKLHIEPLPTGSGVRYESNIGVNDVALKYQNEVQQSLAGALRQGIKGWEVTDLKITLVEGEDHPVHSRPGNFKIATPMALMNGLVETDTTLLEPILAFRITAPQELLGSITSDLSRLRASFGAPEVQKARFVLEGKIPAATSLDYPVQLASRSGGKAKIFARLCGYEPCALELGETTSYRGISPLDRAKYILKARGAISE
jgi:ribosomal protection tetracycline resistance protein